MKKIILAALAVIIVVCCSACMPGASNLAGSQLPTDVEMNTLPAGDEKITDTDTAFKDDLNGLCDYFIKRGFVGTFVTEMAAETIGAKSGRRYMFTYNDSSVVCELYEFDLENLGDTGKKVLDEIKSDGEFNAKNNTKIKAMLSNSGKYMMIYTDKKADEQKEKYKDTVSGDEEKDFYNHLRRAAVEKAFKEFKQK